MGTSPNASDPMKGAREPALDEAALDALFVRLEKPLLNVVYRWLWSTEDSCDVVQEAFVRLWRMRARVRMDTVEALVYRIALNLAASQRRKRRLWRWVSLDELATATGDGPPVERMMQGEVSSVVRRAVNALPEKLRRALVLCELTDLTQQQIGHILGVPAGTVASRRHRALRRLRRQLPTAQQQAGERNKIQEHSAEKNEREKRGVRP